MDCGLQSVLQVTQDYSIGQQRIMKLWLAICPTGEGVTCTVHVHVHNYDYGLEHQSHRTEFMHNLFVTTLLLPSLHTYLMALKSGTVVIRRVVSVTLLE